MLPPRLRAAIVLLAALLTALLTAPAALAADAAGAPGAAAGGTRPLLVIGAGGLTWDDVTPAAMPTLTRLAATGGTADLVVRTVRDTTCAHDGWLTLGAGGRATSPSPCRPPADPVPTPAERGTAPSGAAMVPGWAADLRATRDALSGARPGTLGPALACLAAVGPGAALAAADTTGRVATWGGTVSPDAVKAALARCPSAVVDIGQVSGPDRAASLRALDGRLAQALAAAPGADVVVAVLADDSSARLRPLVVHAPGLDGHLLTSRSTRQPGLVLLTDLAPTIAALRDRDGPQQWTGRVVTAGERLDAATRVERLRDLDRAGQTVLPLVTPFFGWWLAVLGLGGLALWAAGRAGLLSGRTARAAAAVLATVPGAVPAATFLARLVPWWRAPSPGLAVGALTWGIAAAVAALAWVGPWRRHPLGPLAVVAAATVVVIGADVVTGSRLTISSMIGEHPTVGGRFYGLGNASSGIVCACVLLVLTALVQRGRETGRVRAAAAAALVLGLGAVVFVAAPMLGADFGGPAALLPAVLYLAVRSLDLRLRPGRVAALGVLTAGLLAVVCLADWLRPPGQRTHLGAFVETVVNGGGGDVIGRKLIQNWHILTASPATMAIPLVVLVLFGAVHRPRRVRPLAAAFRRLPLLRVGLQAVFLMLAVAMVVNDSGATVPVPVGIVAVPLVVAAVLRCRPRSTEPGSSTVQPVSVEPARQAGPDEGPDGPEPAGA